MTILVTRQIPESGLKKLKAFHDEIIINTEDRNLSDEELQEQGQNVEAILTMLANNINANFIDSCKQLKVIANYAVGYNNIDIAKATKNNIVVTNTPGVLTDTTADLAWALIMAVTRRIVEADKFTREGKFKGWAPELLCGNDVYRKTIGIIGAGRIGQATGRRAAGFDMDILYYNRTKKDKFEFETDAEKVELEYLLENSDIISLHVPLTEDTKHLIDEKELNKMKDSAYLINTARGPVINEYALVKTLKNKNIAGAALDVFEEEPDVHPGLINLPNVVLTPHIGSATVRTRNKMAEMAADSIIKVLSDERPKDVVNPEVYK